MASKKLCEFWKADRYGPGRGGCYAAGEEGNIVCLTEGELGGKLIPDCMSFPFGITADRDRERARAKAAESRLSEMTRAAEELATDRDEILQVLSQEQYDLADERDSNDALRKRVADLEGAGEVLVQALLVKWRAQWPAFLRGDIDAIIAWDDVPKEGK